MAELLKKVLVLGEEHPKINIICDLLPPFRKTGFRELIALEKIDAVLRHCVGTADYLKSNGRVEIFSQEIPFGAEVKFDFTNNPWTNDTYDQILFIQPYPFTTEEENTELVHLEQYLKMNDRLKCTDCRIVFYHDENQHSGSGDLDDIESVLSKAKETLINEYKDTFKEKLISFCTYRSISDWRIITHGSSRVLNVVRELCAERLSQWSEIVDDFEFNYDLEFFPEPDFLAEDAFMRIKAYESVAGSDDVTKKYLENYKHYYLEKILAFADDIYTGVMSEISFWDITRDINVLNDKICDSIDRSILKDMPAKEKCPPTKADYNHKICNEKRLDTKFAQAVNAFVRRDLCYILSQYIASKRIVLEDVFLK